ncbi:hypothetical protein [Arthrobacter sp. Soil763]|uniref:hypothetical protein n=1 Tax=Arthrobacter sp. Soil763 TaxID=1736402 RepID=UPI0006FE13BF|nr:hypothetical protein [Arthrobacter sp. Soil763]KRE81928.1 hypothetical protein ASG71_02430 [Arthrobacter sp. Soil763]
MPTESGPLGPWQFLVLALLVAAAAAGTVYRVRKHQLSDGGLPDAAFWDGFAGLAIVSPAVLLPSLAAPWTGPVLAVAAAAAGAASYRWTPALLRRGELRRSLREAAACDAAAAPRHRAALERWQRYELDPALCIDYPAMRDPGRPETAAMIRAMRAAGDPGGVPGHRSPAGGYAAAVERLEVSLAAAERAAGVMDAAAGGIR